jgi:hypothetical protein
VLVWHWELGGGGVAVRGVTGLEGAETPDVPALFLAWTVNVYSCPFVKPSTIAEVDMVETLRPPGLATTV